MRREGKERWWGPAWADSKSTAFAPSWWIAACTTLDFRYKKDHPLGVIQTLTAVTSTGLKFGERMSFAHNLLNLKFLVEISVAVA